MAAYEVLLLNTAVPQIQAAQSGDTYVVPRDIAFSTVANLANGTYLLPSLTFSSDPDTGVFRQGANALGFTAGGGADQMVLTSTGLGIGTNAPSTKLTVSGSSAIITVDGTTNNGARGLDFVYSGQSLGSLLNYAYTGETALTAGYTGSSGYFLTFKTENVERARITSGGDLQITTGNLVIGTAGKGIDFSADPSAAGMTSELLDDYEEGTWTPTIAGDATGAITGAVGEYVKVGRMVYIRGFVLVTTNFTANALAGLPFVPSGNTTNTSLGAVNIVINSSAANLCGAINIDSYVIAFFTDNNTANTGGLTTANQNIRFSFVYQAIS